MNKNIKIFLLVISVFSMVGCLPSYTVYPKEYKNLKDPIEKEKVFIINRELNDEFQILKKSGIYDIVEDSAVSKKIKLNPIKNVTGFRCGNLMVGSMLTFGLLPSVDYQKYLFSYDEIINNSTVTKEYNLEVRQSLWLFNFIYPKGFKKQAGKSLLGNYLAEKQ